MTNVEQYAALKLFEERLGWIIGGICILIYITLAIVLNMPAHPKKRRKKK